MATSAEEAMARAKEIAARLSGSTAPPTAAEPQSAGSGNDASSSSSKRKRWGITPDAEGDEILPGLSDVAKKLKAGAEPIQRRVWVETSRKPNAHFVGFINDGDKLNAILEKIPGGDSISIQLKGRGTNPNPILGMPEEPLHVLVEGSPDLVTKAETLIDKLISDAEAAPLLEDAASIADKAADALAASMAGDTANNTANSVAPGYKPAPVASLIHGNPTGAGIYGPAGGEMLEEQIGVPNGVVGYIIGRGGENITSMQGRSGCKIQIQKEHEMQPGQSQRVITLTSSSKEAIDQCRGMIEEMVSERIRTTGSSVSMASAMATPALAGSNHTSRLQGAVASGHQLITMQVPDGDVGLIIGRAGATIKSIQDRSGANIQIPQEADSDNSSIRTVSITHPHMEGAHMAKQIIEDILASQANRPARVPHTTLELPIPDQDVGLCIGRAGCVIREMQNKTSTRIQIPSMSMPGSTHRIATVTGPAEGCNQVKQMIERISLEQSSQSVMAGTAYTNQSGGYGGAQHGSAYGGGQYSQQAYGQHGGGQRDYSAEWAAYYAAQGGSNAVTAAAASAPAPATAMATSAGTQQGADAYYEQFFRYAYYYGDEAARKYYGAWSPPAGTPNPYGTNPAGISAAPPAAASAAPASGMSQASNGSTVPQQAAAITTPIASAPAVASLEHAPESARPRDSGRRGVSNLPAWMTKGQG